LPFGDRTVTSAAANFRKFQGLPRDRAMARQFVYFMKGLSKAYPTRKVLDNVHLSFYPDAKIGVLGVNGSGKSTLLRIMAGIDKDYNGEAWVAEGARVGYLEQEPQLDAKLSVRENVMLGVAKQKAILDRYKRTGDELFRKKTAERDDQAAGSDRGRRPLGSRQQGRSGDGCAAAVRLMMPTSRSSPAASAAASRYVSCCSTQPELLLLDEPTNHLDAESVSWLEGHLRNYPGAILIVTHDRYFLDNVTSWILELDRGKGIPYEGNYSSWLQQKQKNGSSRRAAKTPRISARWRASRNGSRLRRKPARPSPRRAISAMKSC